MPWQRGCRWCFETKVTGPRWQHPTRLASVSSVQIQVQNIQECDLCHLPGGCISQLQSPRLAGEVGVVAGTALQNGSGGASRLRGRGLLGRIKSVWLLSLQCRWRCSTSRSVTAVVSLVHVHRSGIFIICGCDCGLYPGGVAASGPCSEDPVQGGDAREL
ncbi:uncharacterized protein LOC123394230 isoform X2 [Mustela putorius furo]|uniref:Uncharacterized protein LOC123394230 isoform X2 n=1 Tax=Mustela putorius furo TaxID=9669 RepID=A0A8U0SJG0_MUSPF|nr:uncharacterized protein LOC123394230 isoform X2 [Mustela putorius furo]